MLSEQFDSNEWREIVKPLIMAMHKHKLCKVTIVKDGGKVDLFAEKIPMPSWSSKERS